MDKELSVSISNSPSRKEVRKRVVGMFLEEEPGKGTGDQASRYTYFVEDLKDGRRIFLQRPARNKLGFDFLICVEDTHFNKEGERKRNYPKHDELISDLKLKKEEDNLKYSKLFKIIQKIYKCEPIEEESYQELFAFSGYPVDFVLGIYKWFFIEQDIRYWNYSGRDMLFSGVPKPE